MYNATSKDDGKGDLETYENWLERQLLTRIERLEQLDLHNVSQQRDLLLDFFDELDELPMGLNNYDREKVVENFIANNCG